jgi:Uma2 family endonuclease
MATAPTPPLVSEEDYLNTSYEVECEYVDGVLVERNVGKRKHSRLQYLIGSFLHSKESECRILGYTEQRIRIAPRRYRVPDVCVMLAEQNQEDVFSEPPALVIEILSEEDQFLEINRKLTDYLMMGVRNICIADPYNRKVFTVEDRRLVESPSLLVAFELRRDTPLLAFDFSELFRQLD